MSWICNSDWEIRNAGRKVGGETSCKRTTCGTEK
jgi:hypothetical protein